MGKDDTEAIGNPLGSVSRGLIEREPVAETKLFFITFFFKLQSRASNAYSRLIS